MLEAAKPVPWWPAADGPQATEGPQVGFQVKEEVRIGLEFDRAVLIMIVVRKTTARRNDGKRILNDSWVEKSDLQARTQKKVES